MFANVLVSLVVSCAVSLAVVTLRRRAARRAAHMSAVRIMVLHALHGESPADARGLHLAVGRRMMVRPPLADIAAALAQLVARGAVRVVPHTDAAPLYELREDGL